MYCDVTDVGLAVRRILDCIVAINHWMSSNRLKLNLDKTQFLRLGTWQQLKKFDLLPIHMPSGWIIHPSSIAKDLSVTLYSYLTMVAHVDKMVKVCMYQLRQLSLYWENPNTLMRPLYWFMPLLWVEQECVNQTAIL